MMRPRTRATLLLVAVVALAALPVGGIAFALWNGTGTGTGVATTGTSLAVALAPGSPTATLYPGGQSSVVLTASNPNAEPAHFSSLSLDPSQGSGGFAVDAGHSGCPTAALSLTSQTNGGSGWTVPAKSGAVNGTLPITLSNALTMSTAAASACQGATFTVYLVVGP